tara:strand:+ start:2591 stop:2797 length:207 start_codon:yes stop_codon:yes gene_type:complete
MKITIEIDAKLFKETMKYTKAKNNSEAFKIALTEYVATQKLKKQSAEIKENPLKLRYTADEIRSLNRS